MSGKIMGTESTPEFINKLKEILSSLDNRVKNLEDNYIWQ